MMGSGASPDPVFYPEYTNATNLYMSFVTEILKNQEKTQLFLIIKNVLRSFASDPLLDSVPACRGTVPGADEGSAVVFYVF